MKDEALKLALEALDQLQGGCTDSDDGTVEAITVWCPEVIDSIKQALAAPVQEPVAYVVWGENNVPSLTFSKPANTYVFDALYTTPPAAQRQWVGLSQDEINEFAAGCQLGNSVQGAIYKAEAKLKEKNT
jgi:hypothetical protein